VRLLIRDGMDPIFELDLPPGGPRESSKALYERLKAAIRDGRLAPGARLPATRLAKKALRVSRNTAADVYERLSNEGYVVARQGSGTYVADAPPRARASGPKQPKSPRRDPRLNGFWERPDVTASLDFWQIPPASRSAAGPPIDFRPALVDSRLFPFDVFRRVTVRQLRGLEIRPASIKSPRGNQGNFLLRQGIVKHIALTRAVASDPDHILVTSGAQQAFDLIARILITAGKSVVACEDPGYPPMRVAFAAAGARIVPVGVDEEGLIVDDLPADVKVICVCPSHQFPLGVTLSARRRKALIEFARRHDAVIVEDDYDGEFRYEGSTIEALRTSASADVVFYVGTFSKCMLPSLRLGYLVAPSWAMESLVCAKNCLDWHCSTPVQLAVAGFIADGHLARHVRKMRRIYKERRELLIGHVRRHLARRLELIPSFYGMHIAAVARGELDLEALAGRLARSKVNIHTLARYYFGVPPRNGLVFGYGAASLPELRRGLSVIDKALA
jgi:GntR family transcriptional regulator / MocR family aminotransferase